MLSVSFVIAIAAAIFLTPAVRKLCVRIGALDRPDGRRKRQSFPIPTLGGIAVFAALLLATGISPLVGISLVRIWPVLLSAGLICSLGVYDDLRNLKPSWKFIGQILVCLPIVLAENAIDRLAIFGVELEFEILGRTFMLFWLVSGINAVNLLDGMDGLGSLTGLAISLAAAAIALSCGHTDIALLALVLAGALIGFMVYNLPPARVYLGDSGSMVIGLIVSYLTLQAPQDPKGTLHLSVALTLMAVPILDTLLAILRRTMVGQDFWRGDRRHIHHCLLAKKMSRWGVLRFFAGMFLATGLAAWLATTYRVTLIAWSMYLLLPVFLYAGNYCCRLEWELTKKWLRRVRVLSSRA